MRTAHAYAADMPNQSPARPRRLMPGDLVAVLSPSWGGPAAVPHIFDAGIATLRALGLRVQELPTTRWDPARLHADPRARAADLMAAFAEPAIRAVFASIGGDDSIRLLPYLDPATIRSDPKIVMGYSDTTTLLAAIRRMGLVTFHGPAVMAGLGQAPSLPAAAREHVRSMLFEPDDALTYPSFGGYVEGYPDWRQPANVGKVNPWRPDPGPVRLQGAGVVRGELFGGCLEVLDWLRGTSAWPAPDELEGRLLFLEPSEERPGPDVARRFLRSIGVLGTFDRIAGLMLGRERDMGPAEKDVFRDAIRETIADEFGRHDLPILANLPFGHTDPQWVLPIGVRAELDVDAGSLRLVEPWLA
jgi:muramoyltetrapeptide carboxypeptidase LdcA involved in peptidoglycan recycling